MSQDWYDAGPSGLVAFQLWKQGIIRRGGPADIMARRFVMPTGDGECHDEYELCTTTYQSARPRTSSAVTQECHDQTVRVDYAPNPAYKWNPMLLQEGHPQLKLLPVHRRRERRLYSWGPVDAGSLRGRGNLDVDTCDVGCNCKDTSCGNCRLLRCCLGLQLGRRPAVVVEYCDVADPNCTVTKVCEGAVDDNWQPLRLRQHGVREPRRHVRLGLHRRDQSPLREGPVRRAGDQPLQQHHPGGETCADAETCLDAFPFNDYFDDMDMTDADPISKI
jgi:hypothetical protein